MSAMTTNAPLSSPKTQYYRRPLPATCISFCSDEGKAIFREALLAGNMETYFALAAQFRTQEEPAFCGLSTLVMVLNALEVDPKKVWKGPWRFYHENMLDCCVPMEVIERQGITFDQFICLAVCNTLDVRQFRADDSCSVQHFRQLVMEKTRRANDVIVVSYSRQTLQQTGDGHFSPIGGYHPDRDLVLIMDVARFKYPPHWVSLSLLFEAMQQVDKETNLPRGYLLLTKSINLPTVLFRFSAQMSVTRYARALNSSSPTADIMGCVEALQSSLAAEPSLNVVSDEEIIQLITRRFVDHLNTYGYDTILLTSQIDSAEVLSDKHQQAAADVLQALENLRLFDVVHKVLQSNSSPNAMAEATLILSVNRSCSICNKLTRAHYVAMLLILWPYPCENENSIGSRMIKLVSSLLESCSSNGAIELLRTEVEQLRRQLESVLGFVRKCCGCRCQRQLNAVGSRSATSVTNSNS